MKASLHDRQQRLASTSRALHAISPLATLSRGYAIVTHNHQVLKQACDVAVDDEITARLGQGHLLCRVSEVIE